ncbi:MAG: sigma-70 family RNA polymerase sigma factor [Acidobacteriaceae bacterium]
MTPLEETYMANAAELDERNALVMQELSQVYYIASRLRERLPQSVDLEDLVSAGTIGLLEASRHYDSTKNSSFSGYAKFRIRGAILDSLRESDWGSRSIRRKGREVAEATARLEGRLGRKPAEAEVAEEMQLEPEHLQKIMTQIDGLYLVGQQAVIFNDGEDMVDLIESAPSLDDPDPFDLCLQGERTALLAQAIEKLSEREQLILSLYYREELTMKEIAEVLGIALSRVSQIRQATMKKLRVLLTDLQEGQPEPQQKPQRVRQ